MVSDRSDGGNSGLNGGQSGAFAFASSFLGAGLVFLEAPIVLKQFCDSNLMLGQSCELEISSGESLSRTKGKAPSHLGSLLVLAYPL